MEAKEYAFTEYTRQNATIVLHDSIKKFKSLVYLTAKSIDHGYQVVAPGRSFFKHLLREGRIDLIRTTPTAVGSRISTKRRICSNAAT